MIAYTTVTWHRVSHATDEVIRAWGNRTPFTIISKDLPPFVMLAINTESKIRRALDRLERVR